jgi:hypothetical protein
MRGGASYAMPTANPVRGAIVTEDSRVPADGRVLVEPMKRAIGMLGSRGITLVVTPCWASDGKVLVLGEVPLSSAEVRPMMRRLRRMGLEVTALHGEEGGDRVRLGFLGHGGAARLAGVLRAAFGDPPRVRTTPLHL